jgi:hypothetical protein
MNHSLFHNPDPQMTFSLVEGKRHSNGTPPIRSSKVAKYLQIPAVHSVHLDV